MLQINMVIGLGWLKDEMLCASKILKCQTSLYGIVPNDSHSRDEQTSSKINLGDEPSSVFKIIKC